jgi:hypothetical protein
MKRLFLVSSMLFAMSAVAVAGPAPATPPPAAPAAAAPAPAGGPTCGQMMASKAVLPAKMAEVMAAVSEMLEAHAAFMIAGKTKEGAKEAAGMKKIAKMHKDLGALFTKTAAEMTKAGSWAAAPHDMAAMKADPKIQAAMAKMLQTHKDMAALLNKEVAEMEAMMKMK